MTPEEFHHINKIIDKTSLFEMRVRSLRWMLECYLKGTIRRNTILSLIQISSLEELLNYMEEEERYEDCATIRDIINIIYKENKKPNMSTKRQKEIIELLSSTIEKEREKINGNQDTIERLEKKLQEVKDWRPQHEQ